MLSPFFAWDIFDEPHEKRPQWSMLNNFSPLVDIKETGDAIVLRCEMPGIPPDRVNVDFNDGCIVISGTKPAVQECGGEQQTSFGPDQGKARASTEGGTTGASGTGAWEGSGSLQRNDQEREQHQGAQGQPGLQGVSSQGQFQPQQGQQQPGQQYQQGQQGLATQGQMQSRSRQSEKAQWHRIESASGEFRRSFRLPRGVNAKHIKANSKYGVLEIVVSKPSELQKESGDRININCAST
jgi:HSP20 family molecular chaperone IbpA